MVRVWLLVQDEGAAASDFNQQLLQALEARLRVKLCLAALKHWAVQARATQLLLKQAGVPTVPCSCVVACECMFVLRRGECKTEWMLVLFAPACTGEAACSGATGILACPQHLSPEACIAYVPYLGAQHV